MVFRILVHSRHAVWVALLGACGMASACSNKNAPPPEAFVSATLGVGAQSSSSMCGFGSHATFVIGTPHMGTEPEEVQDGDSTANGPVSVSCSVTAVGNGFDVNLNATLQGNTGGSLTIVSPQGKGAVTAQGGTGIQADFTSATAGTYGQTDCTISYTYLNSPVPNMPVIAAGRIWGHISCPKAQSTSGQQMGGGPAQCDGEADFLFQRCSQ
jgi:hypothetical protein